VKGLIYGMNTGWYTTAKVHKKFGFDITIGANASFVPSKDEMFSFSNLNLETVTANANEAPTVAGPKNRTNVTATVSTTVDGEEVSAEFIMPDGIKDDLPFNAVPSPSLQVGLGLPFKTDVIVRYVPEVGSDDVKGNLVGFGLKKEITSIFGPLDKLPLHISILGTYSTMNVDYDLQNDSSIEGENQKANLKLNAYNVQAIASLNFPIINVYGGIGYSSGTSTYKMTGTYTLEYETNQPAPYDTVSTTLVDPINLDFDASGVKATLGTRISLGIFKIFTDYTVQEYNTLNAGISFSFR
ncbi:MAG TPA: DUF6588 family protein, partial [Flavobacteriaceae bacterium]|nr:DUF6588 family protein [Flavobacteriaceae bacterium]